MNSLRNELDTKGLVQLTEEMRQMLHSADGYSNRLKLTVALQTLIEEATKMLSEVDDSAFLMEIREFTDNMIKQSEQTSETFRSHLELNSGVSAAVMVDKPLEAAQLQEEIKNKLEVYDSMIRDVVKTKQELPLECRR